MTPAEADQRIILSRRVIAAWEQMGGPTGPAVDNLRLVTNEMAILNAIAAEHEGKAGKIRVLIGRHNALAESLKLMMD